MATNGNGNGHAIPREDVSEGGEEHAIPLPSSPLEIAEYAREAIEGGRRMAGDLSAMRDELRKAWREQAEINGQILSSLARQERQSQQTHALVEETAIRVAAISRNVRQTDGDVADLRKAVAARGTGYSPADAAALARLEAKVESLEKRADKAESKIDRVEDDVDDSRQMAAVSLAEARAKLASVADVVDEKREERREEREDTRHTKRWALGLVGAVVLAIVSALVGAKVTAPEIHEPAALPAGH